MATEMVQADPEGIDGVRMTWNAWPRTKVELSKCVIPLGASISPIRPHVDVPSLPYPPLKCKTCTAVLNPFCRVDYQALIWICPFCFQRNHFPQHYSSIAATNVPAELYPQFTTIQYSLNTSIHPQNPNQNPNPNDDYDKWPTYLFVLDTCMLEEELELAKSALKRAIAMLPEKAKVGFISYGTQVQVHELGFQDTDKVFVFRGFKELSKDQILQQLNLPVIGSGAGRQPALGIQKGPVGATGMPIPNFLLPSSACEYNLDTLLDDLGTDKWPVPPGNRALRCTGVALSVAAGLLGACAANTNARIIALVGGPCTEGPGAVKFFPFFSIAAVSSF